ncbi:class F sortase [Candidatus Saccharibacteria bacterium]|nr:class F sortase [Candidatus Saccharibacteria bacterium]
MMISAMSLKINSWRRVIKIVFWIIVFALLGIFIVKILVFEHNYLEEKEGSERAITIVEEEEELIEVKPTEEEVTEYIVAPDRPRYLTVEKLGINKARIIPMGVNVNGELATPNNIFDVGWYDASGLPGMGGTMIIDGHNGGPHVHGVFKDLPDLAEGDLIVVERGDGVAFKYRVVENKSVLLSESDAYMSTAARSPESGKESVTLISCTGEWSQQQGTYLSRQFTRAVLSVD